MRRSMVTTAAVTALLAVAGCERHEGNRGHEAADTEAAADAIRAEEAQWNRDYAARDLDAIMRHYAADGTLIEPGSEPRIGRAAIRGGIAQMVGDPNFRLEFAGDRVEVARSGELGFSRGHFTLTISEPNTRRPATMRGTYLTVWRRQSDGSWQAVEDMIAPGPAPAPAAAP